MHHGIVGPGGIGGLTGAVLAQAGQRVTVIVRPETLEQYPRRLHLASTFGEFSVPITVASEVDHAFDVLWITVKATQLDSVLERVSPAGQIGTVAPLLNGVDL